MEIMSGDMETSYNLSLVALSYIVVVTASLVTHIFERYDPITHR